MISSPKIAFAILTLLVLQSSAAFAQDNSKQNASPTDALKQEVKSLESKEQLEGHIESESKAAVATLKELLSSLHHLKRSTYDVFCEVQREDLVVVGEPNVIGPMIVPAIPDGSGLLNTGQYLPARKKWIDYYMAQIEKLYPMVTKELESVKLPEKVSNNSKQHYNNVVLAYNKLGPALKDLDKITEGPKYDNQKIARCSAVAQSYIGKMDKEAKRLYREMKREESESRRLEHKLERKIEKDERKLEKEKEKEAKEEKSDK